MRLVFEVGSAQLDVWLATRKRTKGRVLLQMLWRLTREPVESFEGTIARAVDQAFADFSRELIG